MKAPLWLYSPPVPQQRGALSAYGSLAASLTQPKQ